MNEGTPTGTVTFMFTDIEGSTLLWERHSEQMGSALRRHDELVRASIEGAGGHVFATGGDGFGAVFTSAVDATEAALDAQRGLLAEPWPGSVELRVRIGLHTGVALERGGDYFGPHVNRAARLAGAAHGGQTVMSAPTAEALGAESRVELVDLGRVHLRGIVEPVHAFGVVTADVPWVDRALMSVRSSAGNLPRLQTETVGNLVELQRQIDSNPSRVLTLTGSGGVGKTRAAVEIGWHRVDEFVDGVWFIDLGTIADAAAVPSAVAAVLGVVNPAGVAAADAIVEWCSNRHLVLVVDNCEHVLAPIARLVSRIVAECPEVSILATSREPLGVPGEQVVRIPSLQRTDAVHLFLLRAAAADSAFDSSGADHDVIAAICDRVDGIPLAIELAAARTTSLTPTEILDNLDDRLRLLRSSGRGGLERHQTLRATMTWSYRLLSGAERDLFDRMSVFAGGFDLGAAEAVGAGDDIERDDVIDLLGELVAKSMVMAEATDDGTRYRLLDTLRQYGEERLDAGGSTGLVRGRHLAHYAARVEQLFAEWEGPDQLAARAAYRQDWDNVRAAHAWSCATLDVQRSQAIVVNTAAYAQHGLLIEHAEWCSQTLALVATPDGMTARVLGNAATWTLGEGRLEDGLDLARRGLELAQDATALGSCRIGLMYGLMLGGRPDEAKAVMPDVQDTVDGDARPFVRWSAARALWDVNVGQPSAPAALEQFVAISEQIGGPMYLFVARFAQSRFFTDDDVDVESAIELLDEAIELAEQVGERKALTAALGLKAIAMATGNHPETAVQIGETISVGLRERAWGPVVRALTAFVVHQAKQSSLDDAATVAGFLDAESMHMPDDEALRQRAIASVEGSPGFVESRRIGRTMTRDDVVTFALDQLAATT
jgi:predicted ATPase/class 3 adenylate cyclase